MIAAEVLGVAVDDVRALVADTDAAGHSDVTGGSRIALATGMAIYEAAHDALTQLKARAARLWEKKPDEVAFNNGVFKAIGNGVPPLALKQLALRLARTGGAALLGGAEAAAPSGMPHSTQNFALAKFSAPHLGQRLLNGVPHSMQNLAVSGFSK